MAGREFRIKTVVPSSYRETVATSKQNGAEALRSRECTGWSDTHKSLLPTCLRFQKELRTIRFDAQPPPLLTLTPVL